MPNTSKAVAAWYGTDTYGTHIEVACDATGRTFWRAYEFNGYAKSWGRWKLWTATIDTANVPAVVEWGFNRLTGGASTGLRYRLPA